MGGQRPEQSTASLGKLYGQLDRTAENQLWYDKLKEVIDGYQPDVIWQDFNLPQITEAQRLNFLAYYNQAIAWNIAPMADGTIPSGQRTILLGIGDHLRRFGESIYSTRVWTAFGEGPTQMGGGWYRMVNRTNGMVIDSWGNTANGANARQAAWSGGNNQQWRLNSVGNGRQQIIDRGTNTALDRA
ncbi:RICIN domain-containing protein [Streptosporangium sp. NPDC049304]|uniref:RICIN domain-containing protein n=1 Tax=Streptosporangium sp. NPDC049304 TaxID=3154830 RepID=UPI00341FB77B